MSICEFLNSWDLGLYSNELKLSWTCLILKIPLNNKKRIYSQSPTAHLMASACWSLVACAESNQWDMVCSKPFGKNWRILGIYWFADLHLASSTAFRARDRISPSPWKLLNWPHSSKSLVQRRFTYSGLKHFTANLLSGYGFVMVCVYKELWNLSQLMSLSSRPRGEKSDRLPSLLQTANSHRGLASNTRKVQGMQYIHSRHAHGSTKENN